MIKYPHVKVKLTGTEGNAFAVLGEVKSAMERAGVDTNGFFEEATAGDYNHLLVTCMKWVTVS